jgi:uncharacterized protein
VIFTLSELIRKPHVTFDEDVTIDSEVFKGNSRINGVKDVHVEGNGTLEGTERFYTEFTVTGTMLCPDAITNKEIELPLDTDCQELYSFGDEEDDGARPAVNGEVDLMPAVIDAILLEVPLQATETSEEDYPSGEGWRVISEETYEKSRKEAIDPRLAKLKEFNQD